MDFSEFAKRFATVIGGGENTANIAKSLFDSIVLDEGSSILDEYTASSYKAFYNGNSPISKISNKINMYVEPAKFSKFIDDLPEGAVGKLCNVFEDSVPDINLNNASDKLAELFDSIIQEASKGEIPVPSANKQSVYHTDVCPEITAENTDKVLIIDPSTGGTSNTNESLNPLQNYLDSAESFYSTKKNIVIRRETIPFLCHICL